MATSLPYIQAELDVLAFAAKHNLNATDLRVYLAMCHFSHGIYGKNYIISPGYAAIGKKAIVHRRNVIKSCLRMEELGMLKRRGYSKAGCVLWELVWQSPAGQKARQDEAWKVALDGVSERSQSADATGVADPPPPQTEMMVDPPPRKSRIDHQGSRGSATLLSTSEVENKKPTSTHQGEEPEPDPDTTGHNLSTRQRTILQVRQMNGGKSLTDVIAEKAVKARKLRAAGIDIEQQRAMSEHEAAEVEEEDHIRRVGGRPLNGTAQANRSPSAPVLVASGTDDVAATLVKQAMDEFDEQRAASRSEPESIDEISVRLAQEKKVPHPKRTPIRGIEDGGVTVERNPKPPRNPPKG